MSELQQNTATAGMRKAISVPGCINANVYRSIKKYLMPPMIKLIMMILLGVYELMMLYEIIINHNYANVLMMVLMTAVFVGIYFYNQNSNIKRILREHREIANPGYQVLITFADNIKLMNHTTGAERNLAFADVVSMAETELCIVLFAKKRRYLLIPKNEMTEAQRDAVIEIVRAKCPTLKKRW